MVRRGWKGLVVALNGGGRLGWVQQVGAAPGLATEEDNQAYAVGAFVLAGSGMAKRIHGH